MALIKSAVELALERTKDYKFDEASIKAGSIKTDGKRAAGKFLDDPESFDLGKAIGAISEAEREVFRKAVFEVLIAQVQLPLGVFDTEKLAATGKGLEIIASKMPARPGINGAAAGKKVAALMQQIPQFIAKYQEELARVEQAIKTQWAPKLKEKERQLAARMGQNVRIDPMADPEFSAFYKQNVEALRTNYSNALENAKEEVTSLCGFAGE